MKFFQHMQFKKVIFYKYDCSLSIVNLYIIKKLIFFKYTYIKLCFYSRIQLYIFKYKQYNHTI